jgi:hypothetical protein
MSKQTAVEWMVNEYAKAFKISVNAVMGETIEQAKAMEKEQIINTWSEATAPDHEIGLSDAFYIINQVQKAEKYYNETYGGDK